MEKEIRIERAFSIDKTREERKDPEACLSPLFAASVMELRCFLSEMKQRLDAEEARVSDGNPDQRLRLEREALDAVESRATEYINRCIARMTDVVRHFTPQEHQFHRIFFQRHLHSFLLLSPFVKRAYLKPLGIPGDYEMMNMLYGDHDQGETLFARLINRYSCRVTAARAVTGRVPYMLGKLNSTLGRVLKEKDTVSVMSVGCGPAKEIQELIRTNRMSDRCRVTLIDAAPEALQYGYATINELKKAMQSRMKLHCLNQSVRQLILNPSFLLDTAGGQDLIYAVGLFDYLPSHIARRVFKNLHSLLNQGGNLIIGNFDLSNDSRYYMEYGLEWYLLYRTPEEIVRFAGEISSLSRISVEMDERKVQLYLVAEKQRVEDADRFTDPFREATTIFCGTV